jgi:hypothetical protein
MSKIIVDEKEYLELMRVKDILEKILRLRGKKSPKKNGFLNAFGILKEIKGDSVSYVSKLRKEWRK